MIFFAVELQALTPQAFFIFANRKVEVVAQSLDSLLMHLFGVMLAGSAQDKSEEDGQPSH